MIEYELKKQGDGSDSWTVTEWETDKKEVIINKYMTYEDPTKQSQVDMSNVDLSTMTSEQMNQLKSALGL